MNTRTSSKLQSVLEAVPPGFLVDAPWLRSRGIAYPTFRDYVKRGWLERVARGVFRRPIPTTESPETIDWQACVLSMQHIMSYRIHVGGMTALSLQGHGHYARLGESGAVWLYGRKLPSWLGKLPLSSRITTRPPSLFVDSELAVAEDERAGLSDTTPPRVWNWRLRMSTPERAILESLDELPDGESFHTLDMTFESLVNLRPRVLIALLSSCKRVKTKRLFFVFADRHDHAWRKHIDPAEFDLGRGDRALVKGGTIHPRYRIVVPRDFMSAEGGADDGA